MFYKFAPTNVVKDSFDFLPDFEESPDLKAVYESNFLTAGEEQKLLNNPQAFGGGGGNGGFDDRTADDRNDEFEK